MIGKIFKDLLSISQACTASKSADEMSQLKGILQRHFKDVKRERCYKGQIN